MTPAKDDVTLQIGGLDVIVTHPSKLMIPQAIACHRQDVDLPPFLGPEISGKMAPEAKRGAREKEPIYRGADGRHPA